MINLFVTYRCNLACSYCFARELREEFPEDIGRESFGRLLRWMKDSAVMAVGFIGGEPTLHRRLPEMIEATAAAGITVVLFTNALFPRPLADRLIPFVTNFVVNFNDPLSYTAEHAYLQHANLTRLSEAGCSITFSKNFSPDSLDYDYLLEGAARYGVRSVRYDVARPSASGSNAFIGTQEAGSVMKQVVEFVHRCETRGIRTGLDCAPRLCDLTAEDRRYLERVSMKFSGICHPSIDIHPDLSASYCLPLKDTRVPDVTRFTNTERLMHHFASAVRRERLEGASTECRACPDFARTCQGGCLALRRHSPATAFAAVPRPAATAEGVRHECH